MVIHLEYKDKIYKGEYSPVYSIESALPEVSCYILEVYINGKFYTIKGQDIESCICKLYDELG